ncbi:replication protein A 70 kDa DNA-binding subunit B [Tanacetum coccineum]
MPISSPGPVLFSFAWTGEYPSPIIQAMASWGLHVISAGFQAKYPILQSSLLDVDVISTGSIDCFVCDSNERQKLMIIFVAHFPKNLVRHRFLKPLGTIPSPCVPHGGRGIVCDLFVSAHGEFLGKRGCVRVPRMAPLVSTKFVLGLVACQVSCQVGPSSDLDTGSCTRAREVMIFCTIKSKPLALPWGRTPRLDSGVRNGVDAVLTTAVLTPLSFSPPPSSSHHRSHHHRPNHFRPRHRCPHQCRPWYRARFSGKRISNMGYQKSPSVPGGSSFRKSGGYGGSKGFSGSCSGSGGNDKDRKITPTSDVDPMLDDISVQARCISIWHSYWINAAHDPYSLDMVLQDAQDNATSFQTLGSLRTVEGFHCYLIDVIGSVIGIGDIVPVMSAAGKKIRRTVVVEDAEGNRLDFMFWTYGQPCGMNMQTNEMQLDMLCTPTIHNALFGTKIYVNRDIPEIVAFRTRVQEHEGYDPSQYKILVFASELKVVSIAEFFQGCVKKMVGGIRECDPVGYPLYRVCHNTQDTQRTWVGLYACKQCNKRIDTLMGRNDKPSFICDEHGNVQVASRFKVIIRPIDQSGSAPVVLFNNNFFNLSGYTAWELMEKHGMDPDEYWLGELDSIVGKKCLFKIFFFEYNVQADEFFTPSTLIKKVNILDPTVNRVLHMQSPINAGEASGSGESSGSKKRRVVIDLDEIDSDPEDEGGNSNIPDLVPVKVEPED